MNTTERPMGVYFHMSFDEYHSIEAVSNSAMKHLAKSPWHYRNRVDVMPTKAMLKGTLAHAAQLEPHAMASRYIVAPEDAPKRPTPAQWAAKNSNESSAAAKAWWSDFGKRSLGLQIVSHNDYSITQAQLDAIKANPELAQLFSRGNGEVSIFWVCRITGVYCKARLDWVCPTGDGRVAILDLKSVAEDTPQAFSKSVAKLAFHRQQAHYVAGAVDAMGVTVDDFVFAVVGSAPPILASAYRLDEDTCAQASDEVTELLQLYADCQRAGRWPAYSAEERVVGLPAWARRNNELEVSYVD